jgi:drug/metabolite transporter (DMT)-like permease
LTHLGELAALGTASCWVFSSLAFEAAGRRIGALTLNLIRLVIAFAFLCLAAWAARGIPLPVDASAGAWFWLAISGLVGFVFGDLCLFRAFLIIGPRLSMLMMALAPPLTAIIGWLLLGETLTGRDLLGMILTVTGIAWAIQERGRTGRPGEPLPSRPRLSGVALGFGGALGQAGGLVLSKLGMGTYSAVAANQVRVLAGITGCALLFFVLRWWPRVWPAMRDGKALGFASLGAFFGPFLGVILSLIAIQHTVAGVAASIMALTPVLIIPLVVFLRRERVGLGGVAGAAVAVSGVALLFL